MIMELTTTCSILNNKHCQNWMLKSWVTSAAMISSAMSTLRPSQMPRYSLTALTTDFDRVHFTKFLS
nr:hypothetical protein CFP56_25186 [Quercus suber]